VDVTVNGAPVPGPVTVLREPDGSLLVPAEELARWRLRVPPQFAITREQRSFYPMNRITGVTATLDEPRLALAIEASPDLLEPTTIEATGTAPRPVPSALGGFLNYNLLGERSEGDNRFAGLFEGGVFGPLGVVISSLTATNQPDQLNGAPGDNVVRLDTYFRHDDAERLRTLIVGDAINVPGAWGRSVRFGGVQYGTNFAIQPSFITFPLQAASGIAAVPSVVDVLVNNAPVGEQRVPPGPFSITNIPPITGAGEVQLVVRDVLGREQVITRPFYASQRMLRPGLVDFSLEAGSVRTDYGLRSDGYQGTLASGTYRQGLNETLTAGVRGETYRDVTAAGADADWLVGDLGIVSGAVVASHSDAGGGVLGVAGVERRTTRFSVAARGARASPEFRQVGFASGQAPLARQLLASASYTTGHAGTFAVAWASQQLRDEPTQEVLSGTWSFTLGRFGFFSLTGTRAFGNSGSTTLLAVFTVPLGASTMVSVAGERRMPRGGEAQDEGSITLQRNLPPGPGYGYRFFSSSERDVQAGVSMQNDYGTLFVDAAHRNGEDAARVNVLGGIGVIAGHPFLARSLTDSFGLVRVGDYDGIEVLQDNQAVGRTDREGYAILPRLRAYDANPVSIELRDLPLDAKIEGTKLVAVPYFRSGVLFDFPVRRERGAVLRLELEDGAPLPAGALVRVVATSETFPVANRGEAYVAGLGRTNVLRAEWRGQSCEIEVRYPETRDPLPDLGVFVCRGVSR
jgi:outer membrane usher protein